MKVSEYNQMMAYIRKPKPEFTLPEPKPQELLEIQEENREERLEDTMDKTRPFLMDESVDFIEREEFSRGSKRQITDQEFKKLYQEFVNLNPRGTDSEFAKFLNDKNIKPGVLGEREVKGQTFTSKTINARRNRLNIKTDIKPTESPAFDKEFEKRNKVLTRLVSEANEGEKFISNQQISFKAEKELNIKPRFDSGGRKPFFLATKSQAGKRGFPVLNELDTRVDKIDKVIKNLLVSEEPLTEQLSKVIINKTGISQANFINTRDQVLSYKAIKLEAERLPSFLNKASNKYLLELPLAEQLQEVNNLIKGDPAYTYGKGKDVLKTVSTAKDDAMKYALRNWNLNKGKGNVKFFDSKGKLIPWQKGTRLKYGKVSFEYDGKKYNTSNLTPDVLKKDFKELYETRAALNKFRGTKIPNPFKKGTDIPVEKLIREIQVRGYKWSPSFPTLEILHGTEGVRNKPFTDLRFNTKDINMVESSLSKNLASGKLNEKEYKKAMASVNKPFAKGGEQFIIDRITKQAEQIKKGDFYGFEELKKKSVKPSGVVFGSTMVQPELANLKSSEARNLFKGVGRVALGELYFAPASIVLDTYAGLEPEEQALNVFTFGLGTPLKDSVNKRKYIADLGYGKAYQTALTKRRNLRTAPESKIAELTEDEKKAIFLSNVFDTQLDLKREKKAEEYRSDFEGQLKRGELEVLDDSQVLEAPTRVEPEVAEKEEEEGLSPFFDKILGTFRSNLASGSKPSNEEMIDLVLKYGKNKKTD